MFISGGGGNVELLSGPGRSKLDKDQTNPERSKGISIRQYARLVPRRVKSIGLDSASYGTHSMRRTKAAQIYRKTGNLRAVQLLLGHTKLESTVRYLGIEVDDALNMAEQVEL
jgi:integrase